MFNFKYINPRKHFCCLKTLSSFSKAKTIFALSSGQGKCGVAVIRVSGPEAGAALKLVTAMKTLPKPRRAHLTSIQNPQNNEVLDKGLILWFPGPCSFTGEDSCELQIHGGVAVITAVLNALGCIQNLRLAEPGEFTRRAFYNGKLDLTEVEGIADLLAAETEAQRKQAFLQTEGCLSKIYLEWKKELVECLAHLEAYIDFDETDTIESDILVQVTEKIRKLGIVIQNHLNDGRRGELLRNGVKTVIIGEPNVGKSSLFNILCQRPVAIVTPLEGTTRDVLEVTLDIGGYPLVLADTAGLRLKTADIVEEEGIERAIRAYQTADLIFLVIDSLKCLKWLELNPSKSFVDFLEVYTTALNIQDLIKTAEKESEFLFNKQCIIIINKIDLITNDKRSIFKECENLNLISCKSENGFPLLFEEIAKKLKDLCGAPSKEHPSMNQVRHRQHLTQCLKFLENYLEQSVENQYNDIVLMTEEIRKALHQLGKITGSVTTEQLLDVIFKEFCIGK